MLLSVNLAAMCYRLFSLCALASSIFIGTVAEVLVDQRSIVAAVSPRLADDEVLKVAVSI